MIPTYFIITIKEIIAAMKKNTKMTGHRKKPQIDIIKGLEKLCHASMVDCTSCEIAGFKKILNALSFLTVHEDTDEKEKVALEELKRTVLRMKGLTAAFRLIEEVTSPLPTQPDGSKIMLN